MNVSTSSYSNMMQAATMQAPRGPSSTELTSQVMKSSDIDGDSLLSIDELGISEELFSSFDSDGDGSISSNELEETFSSKLDAMKNQEFTPEEFGSFLSELGLEVPPPPPPQGQPNVSQMISDIFSANDTDGSGLLSLSELDISEELFISLDSDEDGSITKEELAQGLTTLFSSVESGEMSKDEAGEVLSQLGIEKPSGPPPGGGMMGGGGSSEEEEEYDAADTNQDGIVSIAEQAAYDASQSSDTKDMEEYTMKLVSTLLDALKSEEVTNKSDTSDSLDMSKYKQIMSMVNTQIQDTDTAQKLGKYLSNLAS
ncbi:MAG: EF-hand domain-containing protein [Arcobacteraceae bacterium]|nr:EF-hand domain-containing protein [Arcobacteraceae bacterium]